MAITVSFFKTTVPEKTWWSKDFLADVLICFPWTSTQATSGGESNTGCCSKTLAKLIELAPITWVYGISLVNGAFFKKQLITDQKLDVVDPYCLDLPSRKSGIWIH